MRVVAALVISVCFLACDKQVEDFSVDKAGAFINVQVGKFRTYRLDSTVFTNFGRNLEVRSYEEKHVVDGEIKEFNLSGFRVQRYIRKLNAPSEPWKSSGSYFISVSGDQVQLMEDNLRFIKLVSPVRTGVTWKGNAYLPAEPYKSLYSFSNDDDMANWEFSYASTGETLNLNGKSYADVVTVKAIDESFNVPVTNTRNFAFKTLYLEKYARNLGLVFQEYVMFEFQPDNADRPGYSGFGVKRSLLDHN